MEAKWPFRLTVELFLIISFLEDYMDYTKFLYLSREVVTSLNMEMPDIIEAIAKGFTEIAHGRVEMPPKPGIHPGPAEDCNYIHAMPCYIPALNSAGMKWVSGYPPNQKKGLPYNAGLLIFNDPETGIVRAVMDCIWLTTNRTAAASALSARYLARPESEKIGIYGCGVQGTINLKAFAGEYKLKEVHCYDPVASQAEKLAAYAEQLGIKGIVETDPKNVVVDMDIIVTAGPILTTPHATLKAGWLKKGAFISMVDYDSAWAREALAEVDLFTTDNLAQYEYNRDVNGYFQNCPNVYAELAELVIGKKKGRTSADQITVACNLGVAVEDMSVAPIIYEQAVEKNLGVWLPL